MAVLQLNSLEKAVQSLQRAVTRSQLAIGDEELRDAVIQRFEFTYELCWKMLKRQLEMLSATPAAIDQMSYKELLRDGAERGVIDHVERWMQYRKQRNLSSHTYEEAIAKEVYLSVLQFLPDAKELLAELQRRNHA